MNYCDSETELDIQYILGDPSLEQAKIANQFDTLEKECIGVTHGDYTTVIQLNISGVDKKVIIALKNIEIANELVFFLRRSVEVAKQLKKSLFKQLA